MCQVAIGKFFFLSKLPLFFEHCFANLKKMRAKYLRSGLFVIYFIENYYPLKSKHSYEFWTTSRLA